MKEKMKKVAIILIIISVILIASGIILEIIQ